MIAANVDKVFGRLCEAMGRPELAGDPLYATHGARGENQDALEGLIAEWARQRTAREIDDVLDAAGVICGPIYTIADIFEDRSTRLVTCPAPRRPRVRRVHRPRGGAEALPHPGLGALVGDVGRGQPQPGGLRRPAQARRRRDRRLDRAGRAVTQVTICVSAFVSWIRSSIRGRVAPFAVARNPDLIT